jgi:hypothetical protein
LGGMKGGVLIKSWLAITHRSSTRVSPLTRISSPL